jgi:hypothetical protein
MKQLNFYPYYKGLLRDRLKTTTIRVPGRVRFERGEEVILTVGWPEKGDYEQLHTATIEETYDRVLSQLSVEDLRGESPDCLTPEAVPYVLGAIYRKTLAPADLVTVIKFKHN